MAQKGQKPLPTQLNVTGKWEIIKLLVASHTTTRCACYDNVKWPKALTRFLILVEEACCSQCYTSSTSTLDKTNHQCHQSEGKTYYPMGQHFAGHHISVYWYYKESSDDDFLYQIQLLKKFFICWFYPVNFLSLSLCLRFQQQEIKPLFCISAASFVSFLCFVLSVRLGLSAFIGSGSV